MFYPVSKAIWLIAAPTNALILITAAATLWAVLRSSKCAAWLAAGGACALVLGGFTPVNYWLTVPLEDRFPPWEGGSQPVVDGIIVLGGETGERITILAELTRDFPQARLVYSGPGEDSDAEDLLTKFARLGGDRERVTMERRSQNTFENAIYSRALIKPKAQERWLLVTAALICQGPSVASDELGLKLRPIQLYTRRDIDRIGKPRSVSARAPYLGSMQR